MRLLILVAILSGCASKPYVKLAAGYQLDSQSDWYVRTERDWQCSRNVPFQGEAGVEWENGWSAFYEHQSWFFCGGPFANGEPELYRDALWVAKKWGGVN